jgi:hypothetical protein
MYLLPHNCSWDAGSFGIAYAAIYRYVLFAIQIDTGELMRHEHEF